MNIVVILNKLISNLGIVPTDLLKEENPYKTLLKRTRLKLKKLHPDAGGNADEFDTLHKLYELLLKYKADTPDYEKYIQSGLALIIKGNIDVNINSNNEIINMGLMPKRTVYGRTNIEELVLHFNKLTYCKTEEDKALLHELIIVPIDVVAIEPINNTDETELSSVTITKSLKHSYNGAYSTIIALSVKQGTVIKIRVRGFSQTFEYKVESDVFYKAVLNENFVKLELTVQIQVET